MSVRERMDAAGIVLPPVAAPKGVYVPAVRTGSQVWTSGQLPLVDGQLPATGLVGAEVTVEAAAGFARQAALNALAAIDALVGLDAVSRVVKVVGFVASARVRRAAPGGERRVGAHGRGLRSVGRTRPLGDRGRGAAAGRAGRG